MQSIAYIPGSNGAGNSSQMTVQNVRSPGASDILVNTVTGVPAKFCGSMGEPHTFTDPVTSETITIISEATAVDFAGHIDTGKIVIDEIAPGYEDTRGSLVGDIVVVRPTTDWANNLFNVLNQSLNDNGTIKSSAKPKFADFIESGGNIATVSGLTGSMSDIVYYINGDKYSISSISNKVYTASKDTYVDVNTSSAVVYTEVANNAASPALAANHKRVMMVASSGSGLARFDNVGFDSLGNRYYNTVISMSSVSNANTLPATGDNAAKVTFWKPKDIMTLGAQQKVRFQPYLRTSGAGNMCFYRIAYAMLSNASYVTLEVNSNVTVGDTPNYQAIVGSPDWAMTKYYATYDLAAYTADCFLRVDLHRDSSSASDTNPNPTDIEGLVIFYNRDYAKAN